MYGMAGVQTEVRRLVWSSKLFGPRDGLCIQDFWTACVALINRGANSNPSMLTGLFLGWQEINYLCSFANR